MSKKYPQKMLPEVHYEKLGDGFEDRVLDLEYETLQNLTNLTEGLKEILLPEVNSGSSTYPCSSMWLPGLLNK